MRHAQGDPKKGDFTLTADNIDRYLDYALTMDRQVRWFNNVDDLNHKLKHPEEVRDELYTPEYIKRRLEKLDAEADGTADETAESRDKLFSIKTALRDVNAQISVVRPLVFDLELGKNPEHHERMSLLDDERKSLEDQIDLFYRERFPKLYAHLPKIYYMIVEGVDISTVVSCFRQMKDVLQNKKSVESAASTLMDESVTKYNLPAGIWDPIKKTGAGRGKGGGKK